MAQIETWFNQDLKKPVKVQYLDGNVFSQDNQGNIIGVEVFNDDNPATLSGSVSGSVIRSDGATVAVSGTLSGNKASIALPEAAYAVPGIISIVLKLTAGAVVVTLLAVVATVYASSTDAVVDPGTIIPSIADLIDEIETAIGEIPADYSALQNAVAQPFSPSKSGGYKIGEYCMYDGVLKRCINDHSGTWNASNFTNAYIGTDLYARNINYRGDIKGTDNINDYLSPGIWYLYTLEGGVPSNWPSDTIGILEVTPTSEGSTGASGVTQTVIDFNGAIYERFKTSESFTAWRVPLFADQIQTSIVPAVLPYTLSMKATPTTEFDIDDYTTPGMWSIGDPSIAVNYPSQNAGRLIVFGDPSVSTNRIIQMVVDRYYNVYLRYISNEPLEWFRLATEARGELTSADNCNNYTKNGQFTINNANSLPENWPSALTGKLIVFGDENSATNKIVQLGVDYRNNTFLRYKSSSWTQWISLNSSFTVQTLTVKASGGTFTTVPAAVKYVMDNWQDNPSIHYLIKIDPGTYDIADEVVSLIGDGMEYEGLWIPPNTTICGAGKDKTIIRFHYDGTDDSIMSAVSAFNAPFESVLQDVTISVKNIRYCIHSAIQPSGIPASYLDDVNIKLVNVKLIHLGFDAGKNPTYYSPGAYGSGSTNGGRKEFYNCDFEAVAYCPWFNHNRKGLTKATEIIFEGCSFVNHLVSGTTGTTSALQFITWTDNPTNAVIIRHCTFNRYISQTIRTDSYGDSNAHCGYYITADCDLLMYEPTTNDANLDDNYKDINCLCDIASSAITAYTPVSKNSLMQVRPYNSSDSVHGIALHSAGAGSPLVYKTSGLMVLANITDTTFTVGKKIGWNGTAWVEDNANPILEVIYSGIVRIV